MMNIVSELVKEDTAVILSTTPEKKYDKNCMKLDIYLGFS